MIKKNAHAGEFINGGKNLERYYWEIWWFYFFWTVINCAKSKKVRDQVIKAKNKFGMIINSARFRHSPFPSSGNIDFVLKGSDE